MNGCNKSSSDSSRVCGGFQLAVRCFSRASLLDDDDHSGLLRKVAGCRGHLDAVASGRRSGVAAAGSWFTQSTTTIWKKRDCTRDDCGEGGSPKWTRSTQS